jgi:hypothetical protein
MKLMQNFTMQRLRGWGLWGVLLVSILLLGACSLARFGYNHGETLAYWWLNSHIDVDNDQQPAVKGQIAQVFAWHRATQLQDYAALMRQTQDELSRPLTSTDTLALYDALKIRAWRLIDYALPSLAELTLSLRAHQIAHFEKKIASNNDEYRKDHLHRDIDHRQEYRYKKIMKQAEYWFGSFSAEQEALIRRASDARPLDNEFLMEQRLKRQQALIALLKKIQAEQPSREATMALLKKYAQSVLEPPPHPTHQAFIDATRMGTADLATLIINQATPKQKARAIKNLQSWIDNFTQLAAKSAQDLGRSSTAAAMN